jgi:VanZ family protein
MKLPKIKIRRETVWPFLLAGTITWCSGYPATLPEVQLFPVDKVGHFGLYGALATAIARHPALKRFPWPGLWWALPLASAYGLGDEFRQSFTVVRTFEWNDWVADTLGATTAVTLYVKWAWYRRLMEMPLPRRRPKPAEEVPSDK